MYREVESSSSGKGLYAGGVVSCNPWVCPVLEGYQPKNLFITHYLAPLSLLAVATCPPKMGASVPIHISKYAYIGYAYIEIHLYLPMCLMFV